MSLAGLVFNLVTFPGIVLNGIVQDYYVRKYSVPVARLDGDALEELDDEELDGRDAEPASDESGEVVVDFYGIDDYRSTFAVTLMPFFACSAVAFAVFALSVPLIEGDVPFWWLLAWLGGAVGSHTFPNTVATDALWEQSRATSSPLKFVGYPLVAVSKVVNLLRFLWIDLVYAVGLYLAARSLLGVVVF
ncbi:hypothetical protein [Natronobacterium texcoconense]|uniref:Uncharacterized protein n=1 Tax=Natronobacterium texcoconense TaxID=1095778 RepID=A0A1H0ZJ30_NATTX|nr:hypothetical protein [Natronobacterium texcoconense]SDQ27126.1 hypothetical protein SAMN04489842_0299 [Natronobacterium texcoconense]